MEKEGYNSLEDDYIRIIKPSDDKRELNLRHVFFPALLAGLSITVIAYFWDITRYGILFASFGSSAFILYVSPKAKQAQVRNILGAYPLAGFFGYLSSSYIMPYINFPDAAFDYAITGGVAVMLTVLAMLFTRFEHGPAAGAALAFVINEPDVIAVFLLIGGGITLLIIAKILIFVVKEEYELECAIRYTLHLGGEEPNNR
ncbi:MAG: hypothetical protein B6U72_05175 [Candidatus Altiarchaeales archaeon ex4484_2]|nr:MAG: hypothetical protein B6U72_05175 [Candidatus Altiarchaeales archaeon ex4484_2]